MLLCVILVFIYNAIANEINVQPITSLQDGREYRFISLENGLQALLIHDLKTEKSAVSVDVNIGFFADPFETPGLAHLCEHMIFQGESEFQLFLNSNGGSYNAFTTEEDTNYFFDMSPDALHNSLERFSYAISQPLFSSNSTLKEINAVNSEHETNLQSDTRRWIQLTRLAANQNHPYSKFGTGTTQTLTKSSIRDELFTFFKQYYCAKNMKLVVLGTETLQTMEEWVTLFFSQVLQCDSLSPPINTILPFSTNELTNKYFVVPVKDILQLQLLFPINNYSHSANYESKPLELIGNLIGYEGPGSLLSCLKKRGFYKENLFLKQLKGWVNGFSVAVQYYHDFTIFGILMDMSPLGMQFTDEIVQSVFSYINLLRECPNLEEKFAEFRTISWLNFNYTSQIKPTTFVSQLAASMQIFPPRDVFIGESVFVKYDRDVTDYVLSQIKPENMLIFVTSKENKVSKKEPWYGTLYDVQSFEPSFYKMHTNLSNELFLPRPNQFIPTDFKVGSENSAEQPSLLINNTVEFWHFYDTSFQLPEVNWNVLIQSSHLYTSAKNFVLASLIVNCFVDDINEDLYDAIFVGLDYFIQAQPRGIQIQVSGFHDNTPKLLKYILLRFFQYSPTEQQFLRIKDRMIRGLGDKKKESPYKLAETISGLLLNSPSWFPDKFIEALQEIDYDAVTSHNFLPEIKIVTLCHGNVLKEKAIQEFKEVVNTINMTTSRQPIQKPKVITLKNRSQYFTKYSENPVDIASAVKFYLQFGDSKVEKTAIAKFCGNLLEEMFLQELRTQQQLGYIVYGSFERTFTMDGLKFVIQSTKAPSFIEEQIESFLDNYFEILVNMSADDFENNKKAFVQILAQKPYNLSDKTKRLWFEIENERYDWNIMQKQADALSSTAKDDVIQFYQQFILQTGSYRKKLVVQILPQPQEFINSQEIIL